MEGEKYFIVGKQKGQIGKRVLRVQIQDDRVWTSKRREEHLEEDSFSSRNSNHRALSRMNGGGASISRGGEGSGAQDQAVCSVHLASMTEKGCPWSMSAES